MYNTPISHDSIYNILELFINKSSKDKSQLQLDNFINKAIENNDYSFSTGLLGAGWLVAYLHQMEILTDDIDELLFDFDDNFYKIAINAIVVESTTLCETLEIINYFQQRIQNRQIKFNFYRRFVLFEIIKLLNEKLVNMISLKSLIISDSVKILLKFSYLIKTFINEKDLGNVFYSKTEELILHFQNKKIFDNTDLENIYILLIACIQFGNPHWVKTIRNLLPKVNNSSESLLSFLRMIVQLMIQDSKRAKIGFKDLKSDINSYHLGFIVTNLKGISV
ncbi:hypothetical protein [Sphingobacterium sp. JUb56]|uniref:hypothetical protein n=1 Tax=Sphingobacterium sp. JUb56 TaxID=2587145 RepID=UPI00160CB407|nr:hypothetical protein [Sphingobacterium sp. JUb56]MBB2951297.1 hypothetical protein [Sphingobacterium sp. JUb56]